MSKLSIWVSHTLSEKNKENRISITTSRLLRQKNDLFLKNIMTGDERWVFYYFVQCERQWIDKDESLQPTPREALYERKLILRVHRITGIIHF